MDGYSTFDIACGWVGGQVQGFRWNQVRSSKLRWGPQGFRWGRASCSGVGWVPIMSGGVGPLAMESGVVF